MYQEKGRLFFPHKSIASGDPQYMESVASKLAIRRCLEQRIDKGGYRTAASKNDQKPKDQQYDDDRSEPELLSFFHEQPEVV